MTAKTIANKNFPIPNEGGFRSGSLLSMAVMLRHHCNRTARCRRTAGIRLFMIPRQDIYL
jgi:hypothetical protein